MDAPPDLIARIWERKGADGGSIRLLRNNLVFVAAEEGRIEDMRGKMSHRLALRELKAPVRLAELADHQQQKVREMEGKSEAELATAIQQCFRHIFYPSQNRMPGAEVGLAHGALETHSVSERPGAGQQGIARRLRDDRKLRVAEDEPDSPAYTRDRAPLKRGQITTAALREEFRRDPALPMFVSDDVFTKGVRRGDLLYAQDDPNASILIDEQATVFTMAYAKDHGIWPRPQASPPGVPQGAFPLPQAIGGGMAEATAGSPLGTRESVRAGAVPEPAGPRRFFHEGLLREALIRAWEQARRRHRAGRRTHHPHVRRRRHLSPPVGRGRAAPGRPQDRGLRGRLRDGRRQRARHRVPRQHRRRAAAQGLPRSPASRDGREEFAGPVRAWVRRRPAHVRRRGGKADQADDQVRDRLRLRGGCRGRGRG